MIICSCYINFHFLSLVMKEAKIGRVNPFIASNPFYVPQKFYSQQKRSYQSNFESSSINYQQASNFASKQSCTVLKKHANIKQNPFFRRHLLPAQPNQQMISWSGKFEEKRLKLYIVNKKYEGIGEFDEKKQRRMNWENQSPKGKENEGKFHSSELKIKLRSQTELNQYLSSMGEISIPPETSAKHILSEETGPKKNNPPIQIIVNDKVYYLISTS